MDSHMDVQERVNRWLRSGSTQHLDLSDLTITKYPEYSPPYSPCVIFKDDYITNIPEYLRRNILLKVNPKLMPKDHNYRYPYFTSHFKYSNFNCKRVMIDGANFRYHFSINFPKFATKIQIAFRNYKKRKVFNELNKEYIKNVCTVICQYLN